MRRFWSDRKGNIAVLFAFAIVPVIGAVGAAFDYSIASAYRADLQKALDATGLALSKILPTDDQTMNTVANQYFTASLGPNDLTNIQLTITPTQGKVVVAATANYNPKIAPIFGGGMFQIGAQSEATWSLGKVEVALALDNTGSMSSSNKINELKTAVHNLLNVLEGAAKTPGDAKVAIIPFDRMINIDGTTHVPANLIKWNYWDQNYGSCTINGKNTQSACQSSNHCVGANGNSQNQCQNRGGVWTPGVWTPENHANWNGCVVDRDKDPNLNHDVLDTAPAAGNPATHYPAAKCSGLVSIMPLNYDWTALHAKTDTMNASGNTNVTIGLTWAWHALSNTSPLTQGVTNGTPNVTKFVILLTDGDNTQNRWSTSQAQIDARTQAACTNVKNAGIQIYTIRVINGNAGLLQNCATNPGMYYDVQNAGQLAGVFNAIGAQIANLHLSK